MVNFDFLDRRSAERFAELLDETTGGRRHHARAQADEQLAGMVAIGHSLAAVRPGVQVDPEFRVGLRAMLVATAERDGIGRSAAATDATSAPTGAAESGFGTLRVGTARRFRARGAIVIGVAAGAMAVSGISAASDNAAPGDALYGVKRSTERAQLAMAGSDLTRGQLWLDFARNRLAEAAAMGDSTRFGQVLDDMDADTRTGVRLLASAAVARQDDGPLATIESFAVGQQRTLTTVLDGLNQANRARAITSLDLLDDVLQRAKDLKAGLACDPPIPDGTDSLGPKLQDCPAGTNTATEREEPGRSEKPGKPATAAEKDTSKAKPEPTATEPAPDRQLNADAVPPGTAETDDDHAPTASAAPSTGSQDGAEGDQGLLGGLLNGIFGASA
ncbi:hypothetical protein EV385_2187 [Krasilnikovia cinnamomea]|uniref:DUF5667 domain-containing protein n=1 Tax=Krasilnikovia cinnamomea TaxID=349313 RepID=A0A4Q7ZJJ0_9ACTN|nr:DUF5667 domain-containing protein [Krasilnikovia cinnamomea]RZU50415.1 hypothetical protein EV385_2187 [Krasilnikovia cinnamomea]